MTADFPIILPLTKLGHVEKVGPTVIKTGHGIHYEDDKGTRLIDALSSGWSLALGHGREDLIEAATKQMKVLAFSSSMYGYTHEAGMQLAQRLVEITPKGLTRVHFTCGGSDANDTAIKLVFLYNNLLGRRKKKNIIAIKGAYHGLTLAAAGLTGLDDCHDNYDLPLPFQHHIEGYHPFRSAFGRTDEEIVAGTMDALRNKGQELGPETVAAVIVEPFRQTGGAIFPPKGWLKAVRDYCTQNDILMIVDEVISGFGRTGKMFACEHEGVEPDMMSLAKAITSGYSPLGALMVSEKIFRVMADKPGDQTFFSHGFTAGGHPVAAAIASAAIDAYQAPGFMDQVARVGDHLQRRMQEFAEYEMVANIRGQGMVAAIELISDPRTMAPVPASWNVFNLIRAEGYERGITLRAYEHTNICLAPPLVCTVEDIDNIVDKTKDALEAILPKLAVAA